LLLIKYFIDEIQNHNILRLSYINEDELGQWLKLFSRLPFLPFEQVEDGFIQIMSSCPNETDGHIFSDYILKTYIEPECLFPPEIWIK
jgi:hypothetical protein